MSRIAAFRKFLREAPWQMWTAQAAAILRIELGRNLRRRRSLWLYLLAAAPILLIGAHSIQSPFGLHCNINEDTGILAGIFQF